MGSSVVDVYGEIELCFDCEIDWGEAMTSGEAGAAASIGINAVHAITEEGPVRLHDETRDAIIEAMSDETIAKIAEQALAAELDGARPPRPDEFAN